MFDLSFFLALAFNVVAPIVILIVFWRQGVRAEYFFQYDFWFWLIGLPLIVILIHFVGNLFEGDKTVIAVTKEGNLVEGEEIFRSAMLKIFIGYWAAFLVTYTLGFIRGRFKRRKEEGIIRS